MLANSAGELRQKLLESAAQLVRVAEELGHIEGLPFTQAVLVARVEVLGRDLSLIRPTTYVASEPDSLCDEYPEGNWEDGWG
jgi:hypothetical protein